MSDWVNARCPNCGGHAKKTTTMLLGSPVPIVVCPCMTGEDWGMTTKPVEDDIARARRKRATQHARRR